MPPLKLLTKQLLVLRSCLRSTSVGTHAKHRKAAPQSEPSSQCMIEGIHKNPWEDRQQEGLSPGMRVGNTLLIGHSFTVGSGNMGFPRIPGPDQQSEQNLHWWTPAA